MPELLKGRVIKIIDEYRVVVDIGYEHGLKNDMKFFIYSLGEEIRDPITGNIIERREIVKHKLKVNHIQEKISIMESDEYKYIPSHIVGTYKDLFEPATKTIPFSIENKPLVSDDEENKNIKEGDYVRQYIE